MTYIRIPKSTKVDYSAFRLVKFGGSSIANPKRFRQVVSLISTNQPVFVVLSALFGTTDKLVQLARFIKEKNSKAFVSLLIDLKVEYFNFVGELYATAKYEDEARELINNAFDWLEDCFERKYKLKLEKEILAIGEQLSTQFLNILLREEGVDALLLEATEFIHLKKSGLPDYERIGLSLKHKIETGKKAQIYITQGFLCSNSKGEIDNLQRGGSDYTATILASVLQVKEVEIWTDIDGVHNNDPRFVNQTASLNYLSYDEASYLAFFGAKILHPLCIAPVKKANIPIRLKNTLKPSSEGTLIHHQVKGEGIKAISAKDNIQIVKINSKHDRAPYDFYNAVFRLLNKYKISSDLITSSEESVALAIEDIEPIEQLSEELSALGKIEYEGGLSAICIVGEFVKESKGLGKKIFESLFDIPLRMISYGGSRHHLTFLVQSRDKQKALVSLNENVFNKKNLCLEENYA